MSRSFSIAFGCLQQIAYGIRNVVLKFNQSGQLRAKHSQAYTYTQTSAQHFLKFGFVARSLSDTRYSVCLCVCVSQRANERTNMNDKQRSNVDGGHIVNEPENTTLPMADRIHSAYVMTH